MTYFWVIQRATIPDPWNNFKSTPKCVDVDVCVCVCKWKKRRPTVDFSPTKKIKSPILHQIGADPQRGRDRSVRVGGSSELSACWGLLLFIHQTDISNFQFPACRTLKPSRCPTEAPFSNRSWLLRLRKKMTNNWNCTLGSSNQNCRCWWVACVYSTAFTFGQSSVGGGQPCFIVSAPAGRGCLRRDFWHEERGWLTAQAHPACVWF